MSTMVVSQEESIGGDGTSEANLLPLLPDDVITGTIFHFVGENHYRYIATVDRRFRQLYTLFQRIQHKKLYNKDIWGEEGYDHCFTITSGESVVESLSRTRIYWKDVANCTESALKHLISVPKGTKQKPHASFHRDFLMISAVTHCNGSTEILDWIVSEPALSCSFCHHKPHICSYSAWLGNMETLKWARANGCKWDELTCMNAAESGHLEFLQYLRANGCPWDSLTTAWAAACGHLHVLKWARSQDCSWSSHTIKNAMSGGHTAVVQWAQENGCPT